MAAEVNSCPWRSMYVCRDRYAAGEMIRIRGDQCVAMEIDALPPKDKQIRKTSTAQQQDRSNKKHKKNVNCILESLHPLKLGLMASTIHLSIDFLDSGKSFILQCVRTTCTVACNDRIVPQKWMETPPIIHHTLLKGLVFALCG